MKHVKITGLFLLSLLATFVLPHIVFTLQDTLNLKGHQQNNDQQEVFTHYPIISSIYAATYEQSDPSNIEAYDLSNLQAYNETQLEQIKAMKEAFSMQLKQLIENHTLSSEYLGNKADAVSLEFGYVTHLIPDSSLTINLHQILSIEQDYVKSQEFQYLKQADKIIRFQVMNEHIPLLSDEEKQAIAWSMISYLGLSELDDWTYLDHSYESYQAKLQVYCQIYTRTTGYYELQVGVLPLGQSRYPSELLMEQF